jgi:MoaA/NifB/PqqE/SkfB family radical SAM enzyme
MSSAPPPRADLKVGFACNNRCVFCAQGGKRIECGSIPLEELVSRLKEVRPRSQGLVLTGGEPTIYKRIVALVAAARQLGYFPIQIQTNGRMLGYEQVLRALLQAGASEFSPSLHGSTAEVHDALTRAPGSWKESSEGIRRVASLGLPLVTNSVVTQGNTHDLPELVRLLADLGVKHAQLAFVHPVGTAMELFDEVVPRLPDVVEPIARARDIARARGLRLVTEAMPLCFLRGMEELAVEDSIPITTVVDLNGQVADYSGWRVAEGKSHGPPCETCAVRHRCEGPWREYPDKYGWDEFIPLRNEEVGA